MSTNSGSSSLRPAWKGGRGFQPPPTVTSDHRETTRGRSSSIGGDPTSNSKRDSNKFSALQDDDDFMVVGGKKNRDRNTDTNNTSTTNNGEQKQNTRSEAFRSSFQQGRPTKPGRSLADLAARTPNEALNRSASTGTYPATTGGAPPPPPGGRRFSELSGATGRGGGTGDPTQDALESRPPRNEPSAYKQAVDSAKVIRYTREKLLSMRPRPDVNAGFPPPHLAHVDAVALLSETPQDPGKQFLTHKHTFHRNKIWDLNMITVLYCLCPLIDSLLGCL
jgi:hypothetical protein